MNAAAYAHGSFTLRRRWKASPARVFAQWSDPALKANWFRGPPERWTLVRRSLDFRVGGVEVLEGRFVESGATTLYEARFHLIEPGRRLVYVYDLHHTGSFHSVTLSSLSIAADGDHTQVAYNEQIVFIDGRDGAADRQRGTESQFASIEAALHADEDRP